jgi:hypothetical protein
MSKELGIGKASRLAKLGESVSVVINGTTISALAAKNLASTTVLVVFDGQKYYAYPHSKVAKIMSAKNLAKHDKKKPPKKYVDTTTILYRVREDNGRNIPCTVASWSYFVGRGCVRVCGGGSYSSQGACNNAHPPIEEIDDPFADTYSIGYFKRGFLSVLGAPVYELGFFYPINIRSVEYVYCPGGFFSTGFTQPGAAVSVIKGDGKFTSRSWILPRHATANPYDVYLPSTDTRVMQHSYYPDTQRITAGVLQQWNSLYKLNFYRDGRGILLTGDSNQVLGDNIPWETSLQRLNDDETLMVNPEDDFQPPFRWIGYPNWLWRQIDIKAIAIYETLYFNGDQSYFYQDTFKINAQANRIIGGGSPSFTYADIRSSNTVLPPASIISRTYSAQEETPIPPGSGWELLWDTKTCPSIPPADPDLDLDKYTYYLRVEGGDPRLLDTFRSDDYVRAYVTNLGSGRYRCVIRCGIISENGIQYFAKTKIFVSETDSPTIYSYPATIPEVAEDWQDFRYRNWRINPAPDSSINICWRGFSSTNNNVMMLSQVLTAINIPTDLVTAPLNSTFTVSSYRTIPPDPPNAETCSVLLVQQDIAIFLPAIDTNAPAKDVEVLAISIHTNRS